MRPVVLVHHAVDEASEADDPGRLVVSPRHLEGQVRLLQRLRYRFLTVEQVIDRWGGEAPDEKVAVLTFDDGFQNWVRVLLPMLKRLGVPATMYVCPGWWGGRHPDVAGPAGRLLDEDGVRDLVAEGIDLGSHSLLHRDLLELDDEELERDLGESKAGVEAVTGRPCRSLAYPFGLFREREERAAAAAGYELAFGWWPGPWRRMAAPRLPGPPRHGAFRLALKLAGVRRGLEPRGKPADRGG